MIQSVKFLLIKILSFLNNQILKREQYECITEVREMNKQIRRDRLFMLNQDLPIHFVFLPILPKII